MMQMIDNHAAQTYTLKSGTDVSHWFFQGLGPVVAEIACDVRVVETADDRTCEGSGDPYFLRISEAKNGIGAIKKTKLIGPNVKLTLTVHGAVLG